MTATKYGTIVVELWRRPLAAYQERPSHGPNPSERHSSKRHRCKKTPKRFIITRGLYPKQFDHSGECVVNQSATYWARALPETFAETRIHDQRKELK